MRTALAALLLTTVASGADFQTKPAKDAAAAYERDVSKAREVYEASLAGAVSRYGKALDAAAAKATQSGNLDEAIRIRDAKAALDADGDRRELWVHQGGYFQRLTDGAWTERGSSGGRQFYVETRRETDFVELVREDVRVRLFADRSEATAAGTLRPEWAYQGGWQSP